MILALSNKVMIRLRHIIYEVGGLRLELKRTLENTPGHVIHIVNQFLFNKTANEEKVNKIII